MLTVTKPDRLARSTAELLSIAMLMGRPLYLPAALALAMPSRCRSNMISRSHDAAKIRQLRTELGPAAIAKRLGIARSSVYRVLG